MKTEPVTATPQWIAEDIAAMVRRASNMEEYRSAVNVLTGYLTRLATAEAALSLTQSAHASGGGENSQTKEG